MKVEFVAQVQSIASFIKPSLPEISFIGRSNAGKSSLINTLLGQRIARTSSTPGRTQGLIFFRIAQKFFFVDFPGFGFAKVSKTLREQWHELAEYYYNDRFTHCLTVWIYDLRRDPDELDFQMKDWLDSKDRPYLLALTKCDLIKRTDWEKRRQAIMTTLGLVNEAALAFSSETKEGVKSLWHTIENRVSHFHKSN